MTSLSQAALPGSSWIEGVRCRDAALRELTGDDQVELLECCSSLLPAAWATEVLLRSVVRLGALERITRDTIRKLTAGDREALLLHVRRMGWGDAIQCSLTCPAPGCSQKLDLAIAVSDLLLPPYEQSVEWREVDVEHESDAYRVRFRLPTGADQEIAAERLRAGREAGLLELCVESVESARRGSLSDIPARVRARLPRLMAELDPQAELELSSACAACGGRLTTVFDTATFLRQEMRAGRQSLDREIHLLAFHYHWSATEILGMTPRRRGRYIRLLAEELEARA